MRNIYLTTYGAQSVSEQQCIVLLQFFPNIKHCEAMPVTSRNLGPPGRLDQLGSLALDYLFVSWANCPVLLRPILSQRWTARKVYILLTWHVSDILATANWDAIGKINIVDLNITIERRVEAEVAGIVSLIRACRALRRLYLGSPHKLMFPLLEGTLTEPGLRLRELSLAYKLNERLRASHIKETVALLLSGPENLSALRQLKIMVPRDTHDDIDFATESFRSYFLNRRVRYTLLWTW